MRIQRGVQTPPAPQRAAISCWRVSNTAPAMRHRAPIVSSGVRYGAATTATPASHAAPSPTDARRNGSAQQAESPKAAAIPASVKVAVPLPLGGLAVGLMGNSL